jgi:hypothetical protein
MMHITTRTIEQAERELSGWKSFDATCQEDYDYACLKVRELTAEINWRRAGYKVENRMTWGRNDDYVPCVRVCSYLADDAEKIAGTACDGLHYYAQTPETGTSAQGFIRLWVK